MEFAEPRPNLTLGPLTKKFPAPRSGQTLMPPLGWRIAVTSQNTNPGAACHDGIFDTLYRYGFVGPATLA
jgi:hypothetical protein